MDDTWNLSNEIVCFFFVFSFRPLLDVFFFQFQCVHCTFRITWFSRFFFFSSTFCCFFFNRKKNFFLFRHKIRLIPVNDKRLILISWFFFSRLLFFKCNVLTEVLIYEPFFLLFLFCFGRQLFIFILTLVRNPIHKD